MVTVLAASSAQEAILPPDNARIAAQGSAGLPLVWPGSAQASYLVQAYVGSAVAFQQHVKGNRVVLPVRPGLGYQWQVNLVKGGGYEEVVPVRKFQILSQDELVFSGRQGADGKQGNWRSPKGLPGGPGGRGPHLIATLQALGEYVHLEVTGAPSIRRILIAPGATPLWIAALGGAGGYGGPGADGRDDFFDYATGEVVSGEPGGRGGDAGPGGPGGTITIVTNGLNPDDYLLPDTRGGPPGEPGRGGRGGGPIEVDGGFNPPGQAGRPAQPGPEGAVFYR